MTGREASASSPSTSRAIGNIAPAEPFETLCGETRLETLRITLSGLFVLRQEQHSDRQRLLRDEA